MTAYRLFEIRANGQRLQAGWGDHSTLTSARATIARWGRIVDWYEYPTLDGGADAMIEPYSGTGRAIIAVEPITDGDYWPQC